MSSTVEFSTSGNVAVLTIDNPPVNALSKGTRYALRQAFRMACANPKIESILIAANGKIFSGGADIAEFQSAPDDSSLRDLFREIEQSPKPTVAAIHGLALGGALELALVCHYRVAGEKARLGLPEVNIGVIPGAGGTQRLPRLIAADAAMEMITSGKPVDAAKALQTGLVDAVLPSGEGFREAAIAFASEAAAREDRRTARDIPTATLPDDPQFLSVWQAKIAKSNPGRSAPIRALESAGNAFSMTLDEGLRREAAIFDECNASSEGRALQHIFFSERKVAHLRGLPPGTCARAVGSVAIIGAGTMGGGIAMNFLNAGIPVTILDVSEPGLQRGLANIRKNYEISAARGRMTQEQVEQRMALLTGTAQYEDIGAADLVIEAVFENLDVKKKVFAQLDAVAKKGAILATNTSTLDVNAIAAVTSRPADVIGLHFFSPANVMRLVEIVRARETAPDAVVTALDICRRIGKIGVVVGVCYGFVGNRMLEPYGREAHRLLLEGASVEDVDKALTDFGMRMGPLAVYDLAGNDIGALMREENRAAIEHDPSYARIGDILAQNGNFGQKSGRGFYVYEGRDRSPNEDLPAIIAKEAAALGIMPRAISQQEILERCMYTLIDEGIRILEEGIAQRPGDIDVIWCSGYGFPAHRGGPMHWADEIGLSTIGKALAGYRETLGAYGQMWFEPSDTMQKLAKSGAKLTSIFPND